MPSATDEPNIPNKKESAVTDDGSEELTGEKEEISRQEIVARRNWSHPSIAIQ